MTFNEFTKKWMPVLGELKLAFEQDAADAMGTARLAGEAAERGRCHQIAVDYAGKVAQPNSDQEFAALRIAERIRVS